MACPTEAGGGTKVSQTRVVPEDKESGVPVLPQKELSLARSLEWSDPEPTGRPRPMQHLDPGLMKS